MPGCKGLFLVACSALLLSCSGGGDSPRSASSGGGEPPAPLVMTLSSQQLALTAQVSDPAPVASVTILLSTTPSNTLFIGVNSARAMLSDVTVSGSTSTSATCALTFVSPATLPPGTYADTLTISLYYDAQGSRPVSNSPQDMAVTYTVTGSISPDFPSRPAATAETGSPGPWQRTLSWPAPLQ
ncbi:MAG: hypothetical protein IPP58_01390 [Holophagaceae bacterium]|uniref:Uncharacterized protein n=1 Tax=Candidatus Geothrix skivensis TaxID=2954439 RepID=A0A9D7SED1_9BACT|nr:hypothetical protein [Candidatus Geothrix skivensis]